MTAQQEVDHFLNDFKTKLNIWGIVFFDGRIKNTDTLAKLEISPNQRRKLISELKLVNYSEGPIADQQSLGNELWVFGKIIKAKEIYIKISIGKPNKQTICISFHIAEFPMKYPYRKQPEK
jgi:hypothetical protein